MPKKKSNARDDDAVEQKRVRKIREIAGDCIDAKLVEQAISKGWTFEQASEVFLKNLRERRGGNIKHHTTSKEDIQRLAEPLNHQWIRDWGDDWKELYLPDLRREQHHDLHWLKKFGWVESQFSLTDLNLIRVRLTTAGLKKQRELQSSEPVASTAVTPADDGQPAPPAPEAKVGAAGTAPATAGEPPVGETGDNGEPADDLATGTPADDEVPQVQNTAKGEANPPPDIDIRDNEWRTAGWYKKTTGAKLAPNTLRKAVISKPPRIEGKKGAQWEYRVGSVISAYPDQHMRIYAALNREAIDGAASAQEEE
jgi:hypothetical protein